MPGYEIRPVGAGADDLDLAGRFFALRRATARCSCTAFCSTRWQFAAGWFGGGNRRRLAELAQGPDPVGLLALRDGEPVGWCATGPRARYRPSADGRGRLLRTRAPDEDSTVWLVACVVVRPDRPGARLVPALVRGAVALARERGARAVEAWPLAAGVRRPADLHVGREGVFTREGFSRVAAPVDGRVVLRLDLTGPA